MMFSHQKRIPNLFNGFPFGSRVIRPRSTDQSNEFNDLFSDLVDKQGGGILYLMPGTFKADSILVPSNIKMIGPGRGLARIEAVTTTGQGNIIKNSDQSNGNENIHLAGFTVDSKRTVGSTGGGGGIDLANIEGFIVDDVGSLNPFTHCMELAHCRNGFLSNLYLAFETDYSADDGLSISDGRLIAGAPRSKNIVVLKSHAKGPPSAANMSGFEVDDGGENIRYLMCSTEDCYNGFLVHTHEGAEFKAPKHVYFSHCFAEGGSRSFSVYNRDASEDIEHIYFDWCTSKNAAVRAFYTQILSQAVSKVTKHVKITNSVVQGNPIFGLQNNIPLLDAYNNNFSAAQTPIDNVADANQDIRDNRL